MFCIDVEWRSKDALIDQGFNEVDDMPSCSANPDPISGDNGLTFVQYKWEASQDYACYLKGAACQADC